MPLQAVSSNQALRRAHLSTFERGRVVSHLLQAPAHDGTILGSSYPGRSLRDGKENGYTMVIRIRRSLGRLLAHWRLAKNQREPIARSAR